MSRLKDLYKSEVVAKLQEQFGYDNIMQVPKVTKITLNMGVGEGIGDKKQVEAAVADLQTLAGQKVVVTKARKSVAGFKVRGLDITVTTTAPTNEEGHALLKALNFPFRN